MEPDQPHAVRGSGRPSKVDRRWRRTAAELRVIVKRVRSVWDVERHAVASPLVYKDVASRGPPVFLDGVRIPMVQLEAGEHENGGKGSGRDRPPSEVQLGYLCHTTTHHQR